MIRYSVMSLIMTCSCIISMFPGEQLLLLARRGGGGDDVWEVEGETGASQQSW